MSRRQMRLDHNPLRIGQISLITPRLAAMLLSGGRRPHGRSRSVSTTSLESHRHRPLNPFRNGLLDRRRRDASNLRHRAQRPVGRLVRRRLLGQADDLGDALQRDWRFARRTGPVAKQAVDTLVHEPLLAAPDTGLGLAGLGQDRRTPEPLVALQDDPRPPDMFLRALRVRDDRLQSLTVARPDSKMGNYISDYAATKGWGVRCCPLDNICTSCSDRRSQ